MGTKLQKNAIMEGYINSYCLVCECYFDTMEETSDHIEEGAHAEKLLAYPYLEKYDNNNIRKVNKGYFCEFCGVLLATAAKVSLHIQDKSHYDKKGTFLLRRLSGQSAVVAFNNVLINERAWHSITDEACAICNEEFDDENIHKNETGHLLKLVQIKVEFGIENSIYRKTDDTSFQCLTCNSVFALSTFNEHFTDSEHKKLYAMCQEEMNKCVEQTKATDTKKPTKTDTKESKETKVEKESKVLDKNHNNVTENEEQKKVKEPEEPPCKELVCKGSVSKPEDEATVYANGNHLTHSAGNSNAFCRICETKLPATLRSMKEHVNGKEHKNKLAKRNQLLQVVKPKTKITKKTMSKFFDSCFHVENMFHQDVILNEKYCMPIASFVMVTKNGWRYRCQLCEKNVDEDDIINHSNTARHDREMQNVPIITSLPDTEFIREARPGIYHCGYCNLIVPRWEEVGSHLQSREHKEQKDACNWRLQRHLPGVAAHRRRSEAEMIRMLFNGHMFRH